MAMTKLTLEQLDAILFNVVDRARSERPITGDIFQLMYNTGLRVNETLETSRWLQIDEGAYEVQLSKGEGVRVLPIGVIPVDILEYYQQRRAYELQTYSSINNAFKRIAPGFIINNDSRRTTSHAFRYRFIKQRFADGLSVSQIAAEMGHINQANTADYITSDVWGGIS